MLLRFPAYSLRALRGALLRSMAWLLNTTHLSLSLSSNSNYSFPSQRDISSLPVKERAKENFIALQNNIMPFCHFLFILFFVLVVY
jgi:hypothetical protein